MKKGKKNAEQHCVNERQEARQGNSEWTPEGSKESVGFVKERMKKSSGQSVPGEEGWRSSSDQKRIVGLQAAGSRCRVLCRCPIDGLA